MAARDEGTFRGLWDYARQHLDGYGLMNWRVGSDGQLLGTGSATDADEDMAYALVLAQGA